MGDTVACSGNPKHLHSVADLTFMRAKLFIISAAVAAFGVVAWALSAKALSRVIRQRLVSALEEDFASTLEVKDLEVSLFPHINIIGNDVVFHLQNRPNLPALFTIRKLTATANPLGLLARHISFVRIEGLDIHIPPREENTERRKASEKRPPRFIVDEIVADGTRD